MERTKRLEPRPWRGLADTGKSAQTHSSPEKSVAIVVGGVAVAASLSYGILWSDWAVPNPDTALLGIVLAAIGALADVFAHHHRRGANGSIALIPFAACALVEPSVWGVLWVIAAGAVVQVFHRRDLLKSVFNVAQMVLGLSIGILVFRSVGGQSIWELKGQSFVPSLQAAVFPAFALTTAAYFVNSICVSTVLAVSQKQSFVKTWKATTLSTAPYHPLTVLIVFYVAWLSTNLGAFGTAGMVVPMLAVRQLYRTTMELTNVTEELLDLMVAAIEARDPYTSGHSKRVAEVSKIIASAMSLPPAQVERIGVAALLHDVGKIDENFAPILAKQGRLTPEEWEIMKRHPIRGAELVGMLTSLRDIVGPVRHHHENWDGTGYPDGRKGEDIPLASRIIMFADTLDAITTDRPYRKALDIEEARREFIKFRGRQFDPSICDRVVADDVWHVLYRTIEERRKSDPAERSVSKKTLAS
ncbi:MAG: HD-GYP domain-containing protein [Gemmatimonadaceae bacterium]